MTHELYFPFRDKTVHGTTSDPDHFKGIDLAREVMIPIPQHPGAFGVTRKHHVHEGVDLYCRECEPVFAMEGGVVSAVLPFTGPGAGSPWWLDTFAVMIEGESGTINYGEIRPAAGLQVGSVVKAGDHVGDVITVLAKDKGRPRNMLHLELYDAGCNNTVEWKVGELQPPGLRDPTEILSRSQTDW